MSKTDFEIMSEMAKEKENLIGASNELVGAKKTKKVNESRRGVESKLSKEIKQLLDQ